MPAVHPQAPRLLWTDSRYADDAIAVAVAQVRWWRARRFNPSMIYAAFGVRFVPKRGDEPWPSWDDAAWLVAEAWLSLPQWGDDVIVAVEPRGQFALPLPQPADERVAPEGSGRRAPSSPGRPPGSKRAARGRETMDWYRAYHGTSTDPKWRVVAADSGQPVHAIVAVWHAMLECASASTERGRLVGWNDRVVAVSLDLGVDQVAAIRQAMQGLVLDGDRLISWERRQPKSDSSAERTRSWRSRGKAGDAQVTGGDAQVTGGDALEEKREEKNRTEGEPPPLPSPVTGKGPAPGGAALSPNFELPDDWREEAVAERAKAGLPEVNLAAEWAKFRQHHGGERRTMAAWRRRWLKWALQARAEPGAERATPAASADAPAAAPRQPLEHRLGPAGDCLLRLVDDRKYRGWIAKLDLDRIENGTAHLVAADRFVRQLADQEHYSALRAAFGVENVEIAVADPKPEPKHVAAAEAPIGGNGAAPPPSPARRGRDKRPKPAGQRNLLLPVDGGGKGAAAGGPASSPASDDDSPAERRGAA